MQCVLLLSFLSAFHLNFITDCAESGPLILTPLLEAGNYKEAQEKALIVPDIQEVKSYSGYFTVNKTCGNNLFFWFTPAEKNWESAPVVLWLNGGPGCSSLFGMFVENGAYNYVKKKGFLKREHYWTKDHNVIYLDQPVGTGFSFSRKNCYAKNLATLAEEDYHALIQFFKLFPKLQKNDFFITGESYGGHSIPALAYEIDRRNDKADLKIKMIGIMVGNPALDYRCHHDGEFLYQVGMIDENTRDSFVKRQDALTDAINKSDFKKAVDIHLDIYQNITLVVPDVYNIVQDEDDIGYYQFFLRKYVNRKLIHVGATPYFACNDQVYNILSEDIYIPMEKYLEHLLQSTKYTVGFYSGQLDVACLYPSLPCTLRQLKWSGAEDYLAANRTQWWVGGRLAGWYKVAGNLAEVVVRDSGHFVPTDQPAAALDLLRGFVNSKPGGKLLSTLKTEKP